MRDDTCALCGNTSFSKVLDIDGSVSIVKCGGCGVARTRPYPRFDFASQEKYSAFYLDNEAMFRMFARSMMAAIRPFRSSGEFLDVGCSVGFLLDEAKAAGFEPTCGIELNVKAGLISQQKGHTVYAEPLEELRLEAGRFDAIAFNHVLEHIPDAKRFLAEARRILKDDGILYCGLPNYDSFMRRWLGKNWYGWGMPDHIWHFDASTFERTLRGAGFAPKTIVRNALYYPYSKSLRKNTRATVARVAAALGAGDQLYGIFAKGGM